MQKTSLNQLDKLIYQSEILKMAIRFNKRIENTTIEQLYKDLYCFFEQACFGNSISVMKFINDDYELQYPEKFILNGVNFSFSLNSKKSIKGRSCVTSLSHFITAERGSKYPVFLKIGTGQLTATMLNKGLVTVLTEIYKPCV